MELGQYDKEYFLTASPTIYGNDNLRDPQIRGYYKVYDHFVVKNKKTTHAIIVLPTGVGKTGLIGLLPFHICRGKVLIITPQLTIKETVLDSLDPDNPESFWYKRGVFQRVNDTPVLAEYEANTPKEVLDSANIVILNIHKLQTRLESSPLNFLDENYFDMIIIDEAHHSTAETWVATTEYFKKAKVVKLTGTPIRTDGVDLAGELVYKYKLSQAMAKGYVKSLRNFEYIPEKLYFTIDNNQEKQYTIDELLKNDIRDEDWIRRSVAFSKECSISVVETSIRLLTNKRQNTKVPHKIIAVACSISHAEQIKNLYVERGLRATTIHSGQDKVKQERIKSDIENHRVDVIINVAMLGEGYDHPYLSVAAIFRPFKNELPYEQFIGRVLRSIPSDEVEKAEDNIADVVSHKNLELAALWEKYKIELQESDVIKHLQEENVLSDEEAEAVIESNSGGRVIKLGSVSETGEGVIVEDTYLNTELILRHKQEEKQQQEDIEKLEQLLNIDYEQALAIYNQTRTKDTAAIKRPDIYFSSRKKNLDDEIREIIV
ncbi:DEAD/DEAH box helicase, partial [Aminipila sp.]|uniref:DEAD/DEAH box helicase n=1 Tax=Aminipila sp. TaxID=2060095 RepID=UPI0028A11745